MLMRYDSEERKLWSAERVPTVEQEDNRQLNWELKPLRGDRIRHSNRRSSVMEMI
jgi:hypothetical protein